MFIRTDMQQHHLTLCLNTRMYIYDSRLEFTISLLPNPLFFHSVLFFFVIILWKTHSTLNVLHFIFCLKNNCCSFCFRLTKRNTTRYILYYVYIVLAHPKKLNTVIYRKVDFIESIPFIHNTYQTICYRSKAYTECHI